LPTRVPLASLAAGAHGLVDRPDRQDVAPVFLDATGNVLVAGLPGSGVTTALTSMATALAAARDPATMHLYVLTTDLPAMAPLSGLPHCGAVAAADDLERVVRLLRRLDDELRERRRRRSLDAPLVVTVIDGVAAVRAELDDAGMLDEVDVLERLSADGPGVGLVFAFGAEHPGAVGHRIDRTIAHRVLLRLADRGDYLPLGLHGVDPHALVPGRGYLGSGDEVQLACDAAALVEAMLQASPSHAAIGRARPWSIDPLPDAVPARCLPAVSTADGAALVIPFAIGARRLDAVSLVLRPGDHLLVTGPARSGKSTTLRTLAALVRRAGGTRVVELQGRGQPTLPSALTALVDELLQRTEPTVVLVDDGDVLDDAGALLPLVHPGRPSLHVVAAGRSDRFRGMFRHWTSEVRRSRLGLLLRGDELDGDLVGARIPRRSPAPWRPGRGWFVCDDTVELCQVATTVHDTPEQEQEQERHRCA
jgi:S-DNA-T family DNA segregation ATPase FtsK/SpoIIIE